MTRYQRADMIFALTVSFVAGIVLGAGFNRQSGFLITVGVSMYLAMVLILGTCYYVERERL